MESSTQRALRWFRRRFERIPTAPAMLAIVRGEAPDRSPRSVPVAAAARRTKDARARRTRTKEKADDHLPGGFATVSAHRMSAWPLCLVPASPVGRMHGLRRTVAHPGGVWHLHRVHQVLSFSRTKDIGLPCALYPDRCVESVKSVLASTVSGIPNLRLFKPWKTKLAPWASWTPSLRDGCQDFLQLAEVGGLDQVVIEPRFLR